MGGTHEEGSVCAVGNSVMALESNGQPLKDFKQKHNTITFVFCFFLNHPGGTIKGGL